ncbi:MAG: hypothetical protein ABS949_10525 [Solibacillus sp.]
MIQFQFQLDGAHLNSSKWAFDNGYIEGDLQMYVKGALFFAETHVNVVELAIQLGKWCEAIRQAESQNFVYTSLDQEEPVFSFRLKQDGVQLVSPSQQAEINEHIPLKMLVGAVTRYMFALNSYLHEIDYVEKLDRFLYDETSENTKALMLFEQNDYDAAFALLKKLAQERRDVQSLNNLAWMYLHEEEDLAAAKGLLEEVVTQKPQAYFPYNMLGEIALANGELQQAEAYFTTSLQLERSNEALHNLAIVYFKQARFLQAMQCFDDIKDDADLVWLYRVFARIKAGQIAQAKAMLASWTPDMEDFVSATEIADVYAELGEFTLAKKWFAYDLADGSWTNYISSRYAYVLLQLGEEARAQQLIEAQLVWKDEEIAEAEEEDCDATWTELDKEVRITELKAQKDELSQLVEQLKQGLVPHYDYDLYPTSGCYLFGCKQHGHGEYVELDNGESE